MEAVHMVNGSLTESSDLRRDLFRKKFRRSGSLGIPFVPDNEIQNIKTLQEYWSSFDGDGFDRCEQRPLLSLIIVPRKNSNDLSKAMSIIEQSDAISLHLESRKPKNGDTDNLEMLVMVQLSANCPADLLIKKLRENDLRIVDLRAHDAKVNRRLSSRVRTLSSVGDDVFDNAADLPGILKEVPWFPTTIAELDLAAQRVLMYGTDLDADHPGFTDTVYRQRRLMFAEIALNYKHGEPIPKIDYTEDEIKTWSTIMKELKKLHRQHACKEYLENFRLMEENCGYNEDNIPQLEDVSKFLKSKTGFQVRPVAGYLSSRDFLASLAYRVFCCTQYIRHPSDPFYTPEPDCCHELLGHMPLFANPDFAQFSQEIGLASLGASEQDVLKLATLYFFTVEFGLCKQAEGMKVYGAGLLSSVAELKHAIEEAPEIQPFDPDRVIQQECLITTYQKTYFYTESFEEAQEKIRMFTSNMRRPFVARYNPYTESIEILNEKTALTQAVNSLRSDINLMASALHKML